MAGLLGDTIGAIEETLRFRVARQAILASNLANLDTPGYRRNDLVFDEALAGARLRLAGSHRQHHELDSGAEARWRLERQRSATRPDGNGVDFDQETIRLSRNAGAFRQNAEILSRLLMLQRIAISGETR